MSQNYFSSLDFNFLKFKIFPQIISTVRSPQPTTQISWIGFYRKLILLLRLTLFGFCSASFLLLPLLVGIHPNKYILSFVFSFKKLLFPSSLVFALSRSPSPTRAGGHGGCERPCWRLARRRRPPSSSSVALPRCEAAPSLSHILRAELVNAFSLCSVCSCATGATGNPSCLFSSRCVLMRSFYWFSCSSI